MAETNFAPRLGEIFEATASQVNLFRSINAPGYAIGDIAITAAGATYEWDGDSWNSISIGGGAGAAQTPWASNINGGGFNLTNVGQINVTQVVMDALTTNTLLVNGETTFTPVGASAILVTDASSVLQASVVTLTELGHLTGVTSAIQTQLNARALLTTNTFTGLQTITQASANAGILASTGYSLTGSNATSMLDFAGTLNTSGNPVAFKIALSNTASGANTKFLSFLAGASGTSEVFAIDKFGGFTFGDSAAPTNTRVQNISGTYTLQRANGTNDVLEWVYNVAGTAIPNFLAIGTSIAARDTILARDAANTLALRNSTNAQTFNVYNTFTSAANYERFTVDWISSANFCTIGTKAATGTQRAIIFDASQYFFQTGATNRWNLNASGHLLASADNTYDIGASGATRPRNLFVAGTGTFGGALASSGLASTAHISTGATQALYWLTQSTMWSPSNGVIRFADSAGTDFSRLQFGGTTSSFPSWKRSAAQLHCRLADDSADAVLQALQLNVAGTQVIGAQRTGWSAATGGATRTTFDTASVTLPQLAERVKAWLDDALVHGLIGA